MLLLQAPAAAQTVEEQREKDYLEDIIRDDEDVSTKTKPHERSGAQPDDPFSDSDQGKPEGEIAPEDREKIQVQDDLLGDEAQDLTKAQKHEAGVYVSEQLDRKLQEIEGKVPESEVEHYLVYSPSPAARGNPAIKAYERKVWQQALRDYRSAQMQENLLAELDQGSAGELPAGKTAGQGENPLGDIGSLAELFGSGSATSGKSKAESGGAAAGAEGQKTGTDKTTAKSIGGSGGAEGPKTGTNKATTGGGNTEERAAEAEEPAAAAEQQVAAADAADAKEQGLPGPENRILDVTLPEPKEGPTSGTAPELPPTASESFGEAVAQSGLSTTEDAAKPESLSTATADPETEMAAVPIESDSGEAGAATPAPPEPPGQTVSEEKPATVPGSEPPSAATAEEAEKPQTFASRFALDEELRSLDGAAAESGGSGGQAATESLEAATPPADAQPQESQERQRLEETLAVLKWQRNLSDPEQAAADPLSDAEVAAIERAQTRRTESMQSSSPGSSTPEDGRLKEKAELLATLEADSAEIESDLAGSPAAERRKVIGAATGQVAETADGQLRYRAANPDDQATLGKAENRFGFDALLRTLRLRLLHAQADRFLRDCQEPACQLPEATAPSTANETQQSRS